MANLDDYGKGGQSPSYGTNYAGGVGYGELTKISTSEIPNYDFYQDVYTYKGINDNGN